MVTYHGTNFQFVLTEAKKPDSPINLLEKTLSWDLNEKERLWNS